MLNNYSWWKYFIIIFILFIGVIYSIPSFFGKDPIIKISSIDNSKILDDYVFSDIKKNLEKDKIVVKSINFQNNKIIVKFFNTDQQIFAYRKLLILLEKKCSILLTKESKMPYWFSKIYAKPIRLGLDLSGGTYFLIQINTEDVLKNFQLQYIDNLKLKLEKEKILFNSIKKKNNDSIEIDLIDLNTKIRTISFLSREYERNIFLTNIKNNNTKLEIHFSSFYKRKIFERVIKKNAFVLRHRIYQLGVVDPIIQRHGFNCIAIEFPGIHDIMFAKELIGTTASLEFRLINTLIKESDFRSNNLPKNSEMKLDEHGDFVVVYKDAVLTGNHIVNSNFGFDEYHRPQVSVTLDKVGGVIMSDFTKKNVGKILATLFIEYKPSDVVNSQGEVILLKKERIINMATIQSQLANDFRIVGMNDINEARHLSLLLRMGTLASPIHIIEEKTIGPTLGKKNITQGLIACFFGILISIFFMIFWYHGFGVIASTALIANLFFIISIMSITPGVMLTMPSIASIVLSLSVAIDANVLINERIKEEIFRGRPVQYAIYVGYRKAFSSIFDANITTIIVSVILYLIGTGTIKGFSVTTIIGVGTSMFTSIIGTRAIVNIIYGRKKIKKLSI